VAVLRHSVPAQGIEERVRTRLSGGVPRGPVVAWGEGGDALILNLPSVKLRLRSGWLLCNVDASAPGGARGTLQLMYFLGRDGQGDDTVAASTIHTVGPASALAAEWGVQLQRVVWDGVLDAIEGVVGQVGSQNPGKDLDLVGFSGADGVLQVDVRVN